jgi:hypothetical protein
MDVTRENYKLVNNIYSHLNVIVSKCLIIGVCTSICIQYTKETGNKEKWRVIFI